MNDYTLQLVSAPDEEPVSLTEAKAHLRQEEDADDDLISNLIQATREYCETFLCRRLIEQTWDLRLDRFPYGCNAGTQSAYAASAICIPYAPLMEVLNITYIDINGDTQELSTSVYAVDNAREPGRITLKYNQAWPSTSPIPNCVTVRYTAGYGDPEDVPAAIKSAMKLLIANLYEFREPVIAGASIAEVPMTIKNLLWSYRLLEMA